MILVFPSVFIAYLITIPISASASLIAGVLDTHFDNCII